MPDEPDIEKTLRAYANRRRQEGGAPPQLHPATRKLFQDEVARLNRAARPAAGFRLSWLWASPTRLAFSVACLTLVAYLGVAILPWGWRESAQANRPPVEMAKANAHTFSGPMFELFSLNQK